MPLDLQAIKEQLAATTAAEGSWSYNKDDSTLYKYDSFYKETNELVHGPVVMHEDGEFIANAPQYVASLIAEIENLRQEKDQLLSEILKRSNCFNENIVLQSEVERLRNALQSIKAICDASEHIRTNIDLSLIEDITFDVLLEGEQ